MDREQIARDVQTCTILFEEKTGCKPDMCYIDPFTAGDETGDIGIYSGVPVSVSPGLDKGELSMINLTTGADKTFIRSESSPLVGYDKDKLLKLRKDQLVKMLIEAWENDDEDYCVPDSYGVRKHKIEWYMVGSRPFVSKKKFCEELREAYASLVKEQLESPSPLEMLMKSAQKNKP